MGGIPRPNVWVQSAAAASSFTTMVPVLNDYSASVQVVYKGLDAVDGCIRLKGSNDEVVANAQNLTDDPSTMTTATSSILFNIDRMGFGYLLAEYDAGSNSTGTVSLFLVRKQIS
jgi:hypothetical protein